MEGTKKQPEATKLPLVVESSDICQETIHTLAVENIVIDQATNLPLADTENEISGNVLQSVQSDFQETKNESADTELKNTGNVLQNVVENNKYNNDTRLIFTEWLNLFNQDQQS